ncbi:MAG: ATP synthase F0 subunit B [Deferrisomatales bacterium]
MPRLARLLPAAVVAGLVLAPVLALAAGGGTGRSPTYDLAMKFLNFGILAAILFFALRKMVSQGLADRREDIRRSLEDAQKAKDAAEAKYREYQDRVANLDDEIRRIQEDFRADGERQRARILEDAKQAAESIRRHAEQAASNEVKRARDELRADAGELAVRLAEGLLAKAYTAADQKKAVDVTIQNVGRLH